MDAGLLLSVLLSHHDLLTLVLYIKQLVKVDAKSGVDNYSKEQDKKRIIGIMRSIVQWK